MAQSLTFNNTSTGQNGTIQSWTVPATGKYKLEAWGAAGGTAAHPGGAGAYAAGVVTLNAGDAVRILVGQMGTGYGGGGGTFIVGPNNTPLVIAGGGGGPNGSYNGQDGQSTTSGGNAGGNNGTYGMGGTGGAGGRKSSSSGSSGGGGFSSNGEDYNANGGGRSFLNGGTGGVSYDSPPANDGGFGGGGGGYASGKAGGGGGGYSGGGGSDYTSGPTAGGGGGSYVTSTATSVIITAGGNTTQGKAMITAFDPPNAPVNVSPSGASVQSPVKTTSTPTLSWTFGDPDAGDSQSAFEVQIFNSSNNSLVYDTGKVASTASTFNVPTSANLAPGSTYYWIVKTWDTSDLAGNYSPNNYIKIDQAPNVQNLAPGNTNASSPAGSSVTPHLTWSWSDADGDTQSSYQVKMYNASTGMLAYDSQKITSVNAYHDVPAGTLGAGITFYWNVTVWDSTGLSTTSNNAYILTNNPPAPVTLTSPIDTYRVSTRPVFTGNIGDDVENDKQNFKIQLADDSAFTVNLQEYSTLTSLAGWEANNGTSWVAIPAGGVDYTFEGKQVRYTMQTDLTEGKTYYWRMAPIDGTTGTVGQWSSSRRIRVGTTLQFMLNTPIQTTAAAQKIVISATPKLPTDGNTPATLKVEVCNNGLDAAPTWEDATSAYQNQQYYLFTNTTKTGTSWAVDCRITVQANDSLGTVEFDGFGFSFN